jgi:hypothetical protein
MKLTDILIFGENIETFIPLNMYHNLSSSKYISNSINFVRFRHPELKLWPMKNRDSTIVDQMSWENLIPWMNFVLSMKISNFLHKIHPTCMGLF